MGAYPCSNCGATADTATGCPRCGRTIQEEITRLDEVIFSMQRRNRDMVESRAALIARLQGAITIRQLLMRALARQRGVPERAALRATAAVIGPTFTGQPGGPVPPPQTRQATPGGRRLPFLPGGRGRRRREPATGGTAGQVGARPAARPPAAPGAAHGPAPSPPAPATVDGPTPRTMTITTPGTDGPTPPAAATTGEPAGGSVPATGPSAVGPSAVGPSDVGPSAVGPSAVGAARPAVPVARSSPAVTAPAGGTPPRKRAPSEHRPEGSPLEMQNVLLALGGLLVAVGAVALTAYLYATQGAIGRMLVLAVLTAIGLTVPVPIARRGLYATADTVAAVGLVFVVLDGWALWSAAGMDRLPIGFRQYAAVVCLITAGVAAAYRPVPQLRSPRYGAVLALQPVIPLLVWPEFAGLAARAALAAAVGAMDLAVILLLRRDDARSKHLREVTWSAHGIAVAIAWVLAVTAMIRFHAMTGVLGASAALLLAATILLGGALTLGRPVLADLAAGASTLAVITAAGRIGGVVLPGRGLVVTGAAIMLVAFGIRLIAPAAPRFPKLAGAAAAAVTGLLVLIRALPALAASVQGVAPPWHENLARYQQAVSHAATGVTWQLPVTALLLTAAAAVMLPRPAAPDGIAIGAALAILIAPATLGLPWAIAVALLCFGLAGYAIVALLSVTRRAVRVRLSACLVLGGYAGLLSMPAPAATALVLLAISAIGAGTVVLPRIITCGPHVELVTQAARGAVAAALPGGITAGAVVFLDYPSSAVPVLGAGFVATAGTLGYVAFRQLARQAQEPMVLIGATLPTVAIAGASFAAHGRTLADAGVGLSLLFAVLMLVLAPRLQDRLVAGARLDGNDIAAAAVTVAVIAAAARMTSLLLPGSGLMTTALLVLAVTAAIRTMPRSLRRGPVLGSGLTGTVVAAIAGAAALIGGTAVLIAAMPPWHADLNAWAATLDAHRPFGPQVPVALVLLAGAAILGLPRPLSAVGSAACFGLAALGAPAALVLPPLAPAVLGGGTATALGVVGARTRHPVAARARMVVAGILLADTVAASLYTPRSTAMTLLAAFVINTIVAVLARDLAAGLDPIESVRLVPVGGAAIVAALLTLAGTAATATITAGHPPRAALPAALAAASVGMAVIGLLAGYLRPYLPYATAGVALAATGVAVAAWPLALPAEVYAAAAALIAVLMELVRAANPVPSAGDPAAPRRAWWRYTGRPVHGRAFAIGAAAGPATAIALVGVLPALVAALFGPYALASTPWRGAPVSSTAALGPFAGWVGGPTQVITAMLLTLAAALGAIGLPETSRNEVGGRTVAVVVPGVAVTLLIAPAAEAQPWPAGPLAALVVAAIAGLALALIPPPGPEAAGLGVARRFVAVLCALAGGAGLAGSLPTRGMTLTALAIATGVGLVAATAGRTRATRLTGWVVTAAAGDLLSVVVGLVAGLPLSWSAFLVLGVSTIMLTLSVVVPRVRGRAGIVEAGVVEASAYAGVVLGFALAARSQPHLAAYCAATGAVLSIATTRPNRPLRYRRALIWLALTFEVSGWWLLMRVDRVAVPEAYTLAFAAAALLAGYLEARRDPRLSSWAVYGLGLVAGFLPSTTIVIMTAETPLRRALLIAGAAGTVAIGAVRRRQAPVIVGSVVATVAALHELSLVSGAAVLWTVLGLVGAVLISLGANYEKRRRDLRRLRGALGRMR